MTAIFLPVGKCFIISSAIKRNVILSLIIRLRIVCGKLKKCNNEHSQQYPRNFQSDLLL